ncbi:MAG: D-Ala-D-Ala carboxypeptidase family metallohydrolase [Marinagarivorans sp.]
MSQSLRQRLSRALIGCGCVLLSLSPCLADAANKTPANQTAKTASKKIAKPASTKTTASTSSTGAKSSRAASRSKSASKRSKTSKSGNRSQSSSGSNAAAVPAKPIYNAAPITGPKFTSARASIKVVVNGEDIPYQRFFTTVMPGQPLNISIEGQENYLVNLDGTPITGRDHRWVWQAPPNPGYHQVQIIEQLTQKTLTLHVFVLAALKNGSDNIAGFTIGRYPAPKDGKAQYKAPLGFIEVNASNQHLYLSPHFQLGQFLCRQKDGLPQYIALVPDLLEKLEWLLEAVNQRGTRLDTFEVMSGFRTPFYNRLIRNVVHSRHIYGSAADIFIDVNPRDGVMDDLNRDGRFDKKDADVLYNLADAISEAHPHLAGGVGQYSGNGAHGPFVHVDVRGFDARWGK